MADPGRGGLGEHRGDVGELSRHRARSCGWGNPAGNPSRHPGSPPGAERSGTVPAIISATRTLGQWVSMIKLSGSRSGPRFAVLVPVPPAGSPSAAVPLRAASLPAGATAPPRSSAPISGCRGPRGRCPSAAPCRFPAPPRGWLSLSPARAFCSTSSSSRPRVHHPDRAEDGQHLGSRPSDGSSSRISDGSSIRQRANSTRRRWPPDRFPALSPPARHREHLLDPRRGGRPRPRPRSMYPPSRRSRARSSPGTGLRLRHLRPCRARPGSARRSPARVAVEADLAPARPQQPADRRQQRRLARPRWARRYT